MTTTKMAALMGLSRHFLIFFNRTIVLLVYVICVIPSHIAGRDRVFETCENTISLLALDSRSREKFRTCPKAIDFKQWKLNENNLLLQSFPLDLETRNYCREVRRAVFSYVEPVSLKTKPSLVAVSSEVLETLLDIDSRSVENSEKFLEFVSGNGLVKNSFPLAHRYGGHQVLQGIP